MAVTTVLTGTTQSVNATNGSNLLSGSFATTGWVVGATIQGTGIPVGARVGTIVTNTSVTMVTAAGASAPFTGTTGAVPVLVSSKYGTTLTVSMSGATDTATPQTIINNGFGNSLVVTTEPMIHFPGGLTVTWSNIVAGAIFDFEQWGLYFGDLGRWLFDGATILGELRGGYLVNGTQFLKTAGPTFYCRSWNNGGAGGSNMFINSNAGTSMTGLFRMNNCTFKEVQGSNASFYFASGRMQNVVDNMTLDHSGDSAGANASIGAAFGVLNNTSIIKANSGINATNGTNFATFNGLYYAGNYQSSPNHKFSMPTGFVLDGYAPQVLSSQLLGGFANNTVETYSNIDLSTAGWGLNDLKTKYQRYGGPNTLNFPRTVTFELNDSTGANLTGVTLFIKSGAATLVNAVQAGDYSANTAGLVLTWTTTTTSYRVCDSFTDTIAQVAQFRKYGYIEQSTSYSLNLASYSQPAFMLADTSLAGISEATAAAITTAGIDWATKTITPTGDLTYDQLNARIAYELAQTANSAQADPRTIVGTDLTLATGWTLVVNTGRTISSGTNITYWYTPTITLNGSGQITANYGTSVGQSTTWQFQSIQVGSSLAIWDSVGTTKYYQSEVTSAGTYSYYIPPGVTGTYYYAIEKYGKAREAGSFPANSGGLVFYAPSYVEDVGISQTTQATVAAYTTLETTDKLYDYVALKRLEEVWIKLGQIGTREGTAINFGTYSGRVKFTNASVLSLTGTTLYLKANTLAAGSKYATIIATPPALWQGDTVETITCGLEDGAGDSSINIEASGVSTFEIWKITDATDPDDYATGTLVDTVGTGKWRFLHDDGYKFVIRDTLTNYRVVVEAEKGNYDAALFFGAAVQLAQAPDVTIIKQNLASMQVDVDAIKGTGFDSTDSLHAISDAVDAIPASILAATVETGATVAESLRLHNSVLGGKVSGAGTGVETFRDLADSKDRLISTVDTQGNRSAEVADLT